jgi:very-short-patch-repair endonuclease
MYEGVIWGRRRLLTDVGRNDPNVGRNKSDQAQSHCDRRLAELADAQHGVVATWQLSELGLDKHAVHHRATVGRLHRIYRGIYAVGRRKLTPQGHWMAAVLAYGPDAVASHRTAGAVWGISSNSWKPDVTTPQPKRSRPQTRAHVARLRSDEVVVCNGIPVTTVVRTILDLASVLDQDRLEHVIEEADRRELLDLQALQRAIARTPHRRGIRRLREVLAGYRGPADTRSKHERTLRRLVREAGLPEPQWNVLVAGILVDAVWHQWRLVVEIDSRAYHTSPRAFERDRVRDAQLQMVGYRVIRITEKRLYGDPRGVVRDIRRLAGL